MPEFNYTENELKALKNQYAKSATQEQFDLWLAECRNRGLTPVKDVVLQVRAVNEYNPETKQKEFVKRAIHITTIQALRKLAERTGKYAGQLPSQWVYLDDKSSPSIVSDIPLPDVDHPPSPRIPWAAKASVVRKGFEHPITVPARFEAYAQYFRDNGKMTLNSTWANRGPEQLEKCAEALALRKAFPEELGGLYLEDELKDEETVQATVATTEFHVPEVPATLPPNSGSVLRVVPSQDKPKRGRPKVQKTDSPPTQAELSPSPDQAPPANIHGVEITDADVPLPGDDRVPTEAERKIIMNRLLAIKNKGYSNLREYILKVSGKQITNDIPLREINEIVARIEQAEKDGTLKELLEVK